MDPPRGQTGAGDRAAPAWRQAGWGGAPSSSGSPFTVGVNSGLPELLPRRLPEPPRGWWSLPFRQILTRAIHRRHTSGAPWRDVGSRAWPSGGPRAAFLAPPAESRPGGLPALEKAPSACLPERPVLPYTRTHRLIHVHTRARTCTQAARVHTNTQECKHP